jgi:hypothetical protein
MCKREGRFASSMRQRSLFNSIIRAACRRENGLWRKAVAEHSARVETRLGPLQGTYRFIPGTCEERRYPSTLPYVPAMKILYLN